MNYYRHVDCSEIQFDFLYFTKNDVQSYEEEINNRGGRSFLVTAPNKNPIQFEKDVHAFYKLHKGEYYAVHLHDTFLPAFLIDCKRKLDCRKVIAHAHLTSYGDSFIKSTRNRLLSLPKFFIADEYWACSHEAGYALVGKSVFDKKGRILNNAILLEKFTYSPEKSQQLRKELGIEDHFVIGHVGHFNLQKNHDFLIDIIEELRQINSNIKLIMIGDGARREIIEKKCSDLSLQDVVVFLGVRKNVNELMNIFDVFCLPSTYEGLPFVLVESQAMGIPCVYSSTITKEVNILREQNRVLSLEITAEQWADAINHSKRECKDPQKRMRENGFDIILEAKKLVDYYTCGVNKQ